MSTLTRDQVFDQLAALGLASVRMGFYGGHDEGNVEDVKCLDADGHDVDVEIDEPSDLYDALCQPIYDRYGGFDGDPEIWGELVWTVADRSLVIEGSEKNWEPFEAVM